MGSRYLTDLADVCRAAGLTTIEVGGSPGQTGTQWKQRSRSSGGYNSGLPDAVMVHHTASGSSADGWGDANYCTFSSENRPVCNLYLNRQGHVWVCAGGATNTNGSGGPIGPVPQDSMNTHAIGIEAGNNGTGEPWPAAMQDAYVTLCNALCDHYAIPVAQCYSHAEYAPSRKIDPAGPSRWASSGTWPMAPFRQDVAEAGSQPVPPAPPSALDFMEDTVFIITAPGCGVALVAVGGGGVEWVWIYTGEDQGAFGAAGIPTVHATPAQFNALLDQSDNPILVQPVA